MTDKKVELNDTNLNDVSGGGSSQPDPSTYLYKARLTDGVRVKSQPDVKSEDVCVAPAYTIIFVTEDNCPNNFVYCMFKGERHREYGYITKQHFVKID